MFAIVEIGGSQFRVEEKETIEVDKMDAEPGAKVTLDRVVLLANSEKDAKIGQPYVEGASVEAKVVEHTLGEKIRVYKFTAKKRYRKTQGHRQQHTQLEIVGIKG
ncbi:MAG TPA: 50S ribosomal protein L21 [Candidatus Gracilibacteria bacterium]|nr:50S ribosomal protein L21 [Candidatus Gracilibacteria bacterium]